MRAGQHRRTAGDDEDISCPHCGSQSPIAEFLAEGGHCPFCSQYHFDLDLGRKFSLRRSARIMARTASCQECGDEVYRDETGQWRHQGRDADHEGEPDEHEERMAEEDDMTDYADSDRRRSREASIGFLPDFPDELMF